MRDETNRPEPMGGIYRHMWLMKSLSATVGVDLGLAMADGRLSAVEFSRMLTGCRSAGCDKSCALWLVQQQGQVDEPPEFCVNSEILKQLKP